MDDDFSVTVILERVENDWYQARIKEYPEVLTAGPDAREARLLVLDALREYLASFKPGESIPTSSGSKVLA